MNPLDDLEGEYLAEAMDELVHEVASQIASSAINSGQQVNFLLSQGWTLEEINDRLKEMTRPEEAD